MRKNSCSTEADSPEPAKAPQGVKRQVLLHIILGLALLFLAITLLINLVERFRETGVSFPVLVGFLGFILFCIVGVLLLGGELRLLIKHFAEKRHTGRSVDHGQ